MVMRRLCIGLVAAAAIAGCGSNAAGDRDKKLTSEESLHIANIEVAIATTVLNSGQLEDTERGIDYLIRLYRERPSVTYNDGDTKRTPKQLLQDAGNDLAPYRPELADKIDRALG